MKYVFFGVDAESINIVGFVLKMGYKEDRNGHHKGSKHETLAILHNQPLVLETHLRGSF